MQFFLPGFEPPLALDNLFFVILLQRDPAARISQLSEHLRDELGLTGRPIASERLHVSLHGIGEYESLPNAVVAAAKEAGALVKMSPFEIAFDRVMSFARKNGKRPFVLRVDSDGAGITALHWALGEAMKKAGLGQRVTSHFTPHMTLLYDDRMVTERPIEKVRLTVHDFVLVHSFVGQSRYVHLARWPLRG